MSLCSFIIWYPKVLYLFTVLACINHTTFYFPTYTPTPRHAIPGMRNRKRKRHHLRTGIWNLIKARQREEHQWLKVKGKGRRMSVGAEGVGVHRALGQTLSGGKKTWGENFSHFLKMGWKCHECTVCSFLESFTVTNFLFFLTSESFAWKRNFL